MTEENNSLSDEEIIAREKKFYEENKEELLQKYEGKYVAILNGIILDSADSFSELAKNVYATHGYQTYLMIQVTRKEKIFRIRTPKFIKPE